MHKTNTMYEVYNDTQDEHDTQDEYDVRGLQRYIKTITKTIYSKLQISKGTQIEFRQLSAVVPSTAKLLSRNTLPSIASSFMHNLIWGRQIGSTWNTVLSSPGPRNAEPDPLWAGEKTSDSRYTVTVRPNNRCILPKVGRSRKERCSTASGGLRQMPNTAKRHEPRYANPAVVHAKERTASYQPKPTTGDTQRQA